VTFKNRSTFVVYGKRDVILRAPHSKGSSKLRVRKLSRLLARWRATVARVTFWLPATKCNAADQKHENRRFSYYLSFHLEDLLANLPDENFFSAP
jgi:hypothetical protein